MSVLDVGCGAGILAEGLGRLGFGKIEGIDPTPKCIELAEAHLKQDNNDDLKNRIEYRNISIEKLIEEN
jgi:2-polyprenyl-3-methyl-5-hydroxy-6-metoxy-1,4-benzoquinol methylase